MTATHDNPLKAGKQLTLPGTSQQLEQHVAMLNTMRCDWWWEIRGVSPNRRVERVR